MTPPSRPSRLHELYEHGGQSPWIDAPTRPEMRRGRLAELVDAGIRGATTSSSAMARGLESSDDYDAPLAKLTRAGAHATDAYWSLAVEDVRAALELLAPLYEQSCGVDGLVSIGLDPALAHDSAGTVRSAGHLHERVDRPNVLVAVPATEEGVAALATLVGEGRSAGATQIFSLKRYGDVLEAYLSGLEQLVGRGGNPARVSSVACFPLGRLDNEIDRRLGEIAGSTGDVLLRQHALELRGHVAVAQARLAYASFVTAFAGGRFAGLAAAGARVQRPMWLASTADNPGYAELGYVENLIGPDSVAVLPEPTATAFLDRGRVEARVGRSLDDAERVLDELEEVGVPIGEAATALERAGVAALEACFAETEARLVKKARELS